MRKLTVAFLLGLASFVAYAQQDFEMVNKPVFCSSLKNIIESVTKDFEELPVWRGNDDKSRYVLTANQKSGTWTMIQYNETVACVIGIGGSSKFISIGKSI